MEIVINHIPDNGYWRLTHRQFSWSDSAELFVFLAGWSLGRRMRDRPDGWRETLSFAGARLGKIYLGHIATTMIVVSLYLAASGFLHDDGALIANDGLLTARAPFAFLPGVFALTQQVRFVDILPLYAILTLAMPAMVFLKRKPPFILPTISIAIYGAALFFRIDLPTWPAPGRWFFNPFAWQILFVAGFMIGGRRDATDRVVETFPFAIPVAGMMISVSALFMLAGWTPGGEGQMNGVSYFLFDKSSLGLLRMAQFLALALMVSRLSFLIPRLAPPAWSLFSFLGRNALAVFCVGCVISAIGQICHHAGYHGVMFDTVFMIAALAVMCLVAKIREIARGPRLVPRSGRSQRPRPIATNPESDQPLPAMR